MCRNSFFAPVWAPISTSILYVLLYINFNTVHRVYSQLFCTRLSIFNFFFLIVYLFVICLKFTKKLSIFGKKPRRIVENLLASKYTGQIPNSVFQSLSGFCKSWLPGKIWSTHSIILFRKNYHNSHWGTMKFIVRLFWIYFDVCRRCCKQSSQLSFRRLALLELCFGLGLFSSDRDCPPVIILLRKTIFLK